MSHSDKQVVTVNGCHDCPFQQGQTCHFVGFVTNEWRKQTFHHRCPLQDNNILVVADHSVLNNINAS